MVSEEFLEWEEQRHFVLGFILGVVVALVIIGISFAVHTTVGENKAEKMLNTGNYKIDTVLTVTTSKEDGKRVDSTYKLVPKHKSE